MSRGHVSDSSEERPTDRDKEVQDDHKEALQLLKRKREKRKGKR
jgi:hypothetical protein